MLTTNAATFCRAVTLLALLLLAMISVADAMPDSTWTDPAPYRILYIGRLNFDCIDDTLIASRSSTDLNQYNPAFIAWGRWDSVGLYPCQPDTGHHVPKLPTTYITYPSWSDLHCDVAFERLNEDSVADMIFFVSGKYTSGSTTRDTVRALLVFGQNKLDSVGVVNLGLLGLAQSTPYVAMELLPDQHFVERAPRDPSGGSSFVLNPIVQYIPSQRMSPPTDVAGVANPWSVRVYPNPAVYSTNLEITAVPPGDYRVDIISSSGALQRRQMLTIGESGEFMRILDLQSMPSGYYVVQLFSADKPYGAYPILITR